MGGYGQYIYIYIYTNIYVGLACAIKMDAYESQAWSDSIFCFSATALGRDPFYLKTQDAGGEGGREGGSVWWVYMRVVVGS